MASAKQIEANRSNALKSTGPKTPEGKAVVRMNALRHGVTAETAVIPFLEDSEDFEAHREGVLESLAPVGNLETILAERVASLLWRLGRATRYERELIATEQETMEESLFQHSTSGSPSHFQNIIDRTQDTIQLLKRLTRMAEHRSIWSKDAADILSAAASCTQKVDLERFSLPGVPNNIALEDFEGWTAGILRQGIEALGKAEGKSLREMLREIRFVFLQAEAMAKIKQGQSQAKLDHKRRKHLLPDMAHLDSITRYESHLERSLLKTLHEIERLQAVRKGRDVPPPVAVDVTVDAP